VGVAVDEAGEYEFAARVDGLFGGGLGVVEGEIGCRSYKEYRVSGYGDDSVVDDIVAAIHGDHGSVGKEKVEPIELLDWSLSEAARRAKHGQNGGEKEGRSIAKHFFGLG
jgi:hypothetical protein